MQPNVAIPTYKQAYGSLGQIYDPQTKLVNQEIGQLGAQEQATLSSLDQAKVNAFRDITNQSNARGVLFSGVPIDAQATYVGTKYLPGVATAKTATLNAKNSLVDKINQINAARAGQAQGIVSSAQSAAQKAYVDQQKLAISASKAANKLPNASQQLRADSSALYKQLKGRAGVDGYVSPQDYAIGLQHWLSAGYDEASYDKAFSALRNPKNPHYKLVKGFGS